MPLIALLLLLLVVLLLLERDLLVLLERILFVLASTSSTLVLKQPTQLQMEGRKANMRAERVKKITIIYTAL